MCGIIGIFNSSKLTQNIDSVCGMLSSISYRGPDARGVYIDDYVALGHVRLSIIDLAGGNQPIHNEDKTIWITYNGEIYNYPELRKELIDKGHRFRTTTDTEVLVHLYEEEDVNFLNKLNGQWAFSIWDSVKKRLFIARDRVGIRPLYYTFHNDTFIFASEIKALFTLPEISRIIDPLALDQIFTFWTTLSGTTCFKGIHELLPGHYAIVNGNGFREQKYWEIPLFSRDHWRTDHIDELSEKVRELLVDAVKIRLRADVPVGTYLSGGLDSSGVTSIVSRKFNGNVMTFGIRFSEEQFDEGSHQQEMTQFLGVKHQEISVDSQSIANSFLDAVWYCEKPLLRTAPAPLYLLSKLVRQSEIKVVLTGEGADEFHGGYDIFKEALVRSFWGKNPKSTWRGKLLERLYPDIFSNKQTRRLTTSFFGRNIESYDDPLFSHRIRWNNTARIKTFFSKELCSQIDKYNEIVLHQ